MSNYQNFVKSRRRPFEQSLFLFLFRALLRSQILQFTIIFHIPINVKTLSSYQNFVKSHCRPFEQILLLLLLLLVLLIQLKLLFFFNSLDYFFHLHCCYLASFPSDPAAVFSSVWTTLICLTLVVGGEKLVVDLWFSLGSLYFSAL